MVIFHSYVRYVSLPEGMRTISGMMVRFRALSHGESLFSGEKRYGGPNAEALDHRC